MINSAIIHPSFRRTDIFKKLVIKQDRVSSGSSADIIFNEVAPSLAIQVFPAQDIIHRDTDIVNTVRNLGRQFKNAWVIVVGSLSFYAWGPWQMKFDLLAITFLLVDTDDSAANAIHELYSTMIQKEKIDKQKAYFQHIQTEAISANTAQAICRSTMETLEIPQHDMQILLSKFPTLQSLISAASTSTIPPLTDSIGQENLSRIFSSRLGEEK